MEQRTLSPRRTRSSSRGRSPAKLSKPASDGLLVRSEHGLFRVWFVTLTAILVGFAVPVYYHYQLHGVFNLHHVGISLFTWINIIICLWEICLYLRIDLIHRQYQKFAVEYKARELHRVVDFMAARISFKQIFSPSLWAEVWSTYSIFDKSYASKKSFGFFIDSGNGFSTIIPSLLFLYGMTFEIMPARVLGVIGLLVFYQMWYGTFVYFWSYLLNKRYLGHKPINVALFVGVSNGLWFVLPVWAIWAAITLIFDNSFAVFGVQAW
jgi:hypothetical protein